MTRNSFGRHLRSEREQRGITLEAIAESTKIRRALLVALENGDLSKLPRGISGRAFLRGYAAAIGVPPEPLLTELSQLVCEPGAVRDRAATDHATGTIRLTLAPEGLKAAARRRAPAAVADTCAVLLIAGAIARLTGANQWVIIGAVGLIYFTLATLCLGRSFASWALTQVPFSARARIPTGSGVARPSSRIGWPMSCDQPHQPVAMLRRRRSIHRRNKPRHTRKPPDPD